MFLTLSAEAWKLGPSPSPTPSVPAEEGGAEQVVEKTIEAVAHSPLLLSTPFLTVIIGALSGLLIALVGIGFCMLLGKRHALFNSLVHRAKASWAVLLTAFCAYLGFLLMPVAVSDKLELIEHACLIVLILLVTWWLWAVCNTLDDLAVSRSKRKDDPRSRRIATQAQVLRRVIQAVVISAGLIAVLLTFPSARPMLASLLASAGMLSLVLGIAAQSALANIMAGVQIAFADSIRVGDLLVVDKEQATVEEITLTYVVLRTWDDRRLIIPTKKFVSDPFENWTRQAPQLLGTVELDVDWSISMAAVRREVETLLAATELWDERTFNAQMTAATDGQARVRIVLSAKNSSNLWDLRCYIRENLVRWIQRNHPGALLRTRISAEQPDKHETGKKLGAGEEKTSPEDEKLTENSKKGRKAKNLPGRRSFSLRLEEMGEPQFRSLARPNAANPADANPKEVNPAAANLEAADPGVGPGGKENQKLRQKTLAEESEATEEAEETEEDEEAQTSISSQRLYSGSPDAEERARRMSGPANAQTSENESPEKENAGRHDAEERARRMSGPANAQTPENETSENESANQPETGANTDLEKKKSETRSKK